MSYQGPLPRLRATRAAINIVEFDQLFYRVPQRLGTMCMECAADRADPQVRGFATLADALASITLIDRIRAPLFRLRIRLRDATDRIRGVSRGPGKCCPSWDV